MKQRNVGMQKAVSVLSLIFFIGLAVFFLPQEFRSYFVTLPESFEAYSDFVDKNHYATLGFQYSTDDETPVCFLLDVYD